MNAAQRHPAPIRLPALGAALLWGVLELIALWRSRWASRVRRSS
jgi:hypothetical protein